MRCGRDAHTDVWTYGGNDCKLHFIKLSRVTHIAVTAASTHRHLRDVRNLMQKPVVCCFLTAGLFTKLLT